MPALQALQCRGPWHLMFFKAGALSTPWASVIFPQVIWGYTWEVSTPRCLFPCGVRVLQGRLVLLLRVATWGLQCPVWGGIVGQCRRPAQAGVLEVMLCVSLWCASATG